MPFRKKNLKTVLCWDNELIALAQEFIVLIKNHM